MNEHYVHGYDEAENARLQDQASTLADLLHYDTAFAASSRVLEVGCGVGAQTVTLARNSPQAEIVSVDVAAASVAEARERVAAEGLSNVDFHCADLFALPFPAASFDHAFVCFVLEHLAEPERALDVLKGLIRLGGTVTVIEGDHGSAYFHPDDPEARQVIQCLVTLQARAGGDANIGRRLFPLLTQTGFDAVTVSPRMVYADASRPALVEGFTRRTFTAMVEGVREAAVDAGLVTAAEFDRGVAALHRTAEPDGVFCYTFFKAVGGKGPG